MKITQTKPYIMWGGDAGGKQFSSTLWGKGAGRNWLFVKVETDEGVSGWGEGSFINLVQTAAEASPDAPPNMERHWQVMFLHNRYRGGVVINTALSTIDQALWDIKGKLLGVPVYELLGGAVRDRIRVYAGAGNADMRRIATLAEMYGILVAPHNPKGPIATAASVHVCATIANFMILEHFPPARCSTRCKWSR